ncbi:protein MRG1 [Ziziphus jujuba]|uniref:Protein MRG1 n=1 Tax=Ziziphus jujuba TaxID=326968 RepID=A0A6P6G8I1_ZIZJJ|nr:protein MRG1 [Ziziphus jujuba]XP_048330926.2 protein MRG1 [Ziziphus jujuba]
MGSSKSGVGSDSSATESGGADCGTSGETDSDIHNSLPPSDSIPFSKGEKVLAFHNLQIYDAKVTRIDNQMNELKFYVHYLGWNKSWDEWVGVERLMKHTEENVQKQRALNAKQEKDKRTKLARSSQIKPKSMRGKKRKNDSAVREKSTICMEKLVSLQIPPELKKQLVDDCESVTHMGKLVKLPCTPNVDDIVKKYLDYRLKKDGLRANPVGEILKGLCSYFDKVLPVMLLYKSERQQYKEAIADDVSPSTVYGAEHLLRLFVKLPEILFFAKIEDKTIAELQQNLVDFLKFLQKNRSAFFLSTYHVHEDTEISSND